jgi:hypothetical protein
MCSHASKMIPRPEGIDPAYFGMDLGRRAASEGCRRTPRVALAPIPSCAPTSAPSAIVRLPSMLSYGTVRWDVRRSEADVEVCR